MSEMSDFANALVERTRARTPALLLVMLGLLCTPTQAEDLLSIYKLALDNDPRLRAAEANYRANQEKLPQARANLLPSLSGTAARSKNDEEVITDASIFSRPAGQAKYRSNEYKLSLTQPIYNAAYWANLRQASAEVRRAEAEYQAARQDLILRVSQAYFEVLLAQDAVSLARAEKQALARHLEAIEGRRKAGLANITDANDARARYQIAFAQEIEAISKLDDAREALREIVGRLPGTLAGLSDHATAVTPDPPDIDRWAESASAHNATLRAAKEAVDAAREAVERNRAAHYPTLDAVGNRSRLDADASIPGPGVRTDNTVVGLQLTVPLFQGGLVNSRVEEAAQRHNSALQELEGQRRAVERSARAAFQGVASAAARIEALLQAIVAADSALAGKTEGRAVGLYTTQDVLDATRDLYRAKRDYAEARHLYLLNFLKLKNAAGVLTEDDVAVINSRLTN